MLTRSKYHESIANKNVIYSGPVEMKRFNKIFNKSLN